MTSTRLARKPKEVPKEVKRKAGRRPKAEAGVTREAIIAHAAALALTESLTEITIARLARDMSITPGLVHYYVGSHDDILTAVINIAYRERVESLPPLSGEWKIDLRAHAKCTYRMLTRWRGIAAYLQKHNKYRLFQDVEPGEVDYGLMAFDHAGRVLKSSNLNPTESATLFQILMLFVHSAASYEVNFQSPSVHKDFVLTHLESLPPAISTGARYVGRRLVSLKPDHVLDEGVERIIESYSGQGNVALAGKSRR